MPPSPALRFSPGRELRADNHKRGRSLESGIFSRERDEDLALFNELQNRETDNFLLQSNDDFEDSFSTKLRYFSDYKLGISVPARGESSDLLNADGDKNDYDWLITPPDTPLFRSLDDDPIPVNLAQRGRTRTQPISISRSSTMEKNHRSSRGSASPNRLSPSPRSGNSTFLSQGRTSPVPGSSPTPTLRQATPTRRPSSPSTKSSTLAKPTPTPTPTPTRRPSSPSSKSSTQGPRASTPTPRRLSTGSTMTRGTSPVSTSRGSSTSPKVRAWQSNIPGFSLEVPPNLRTSLADRPASYVRGSSPASRNGRDSSINSRRQSMSPASRSVSSSHSQDRDRFSSHSKGSMASSGDDDLESLPSVIVGSSDRSASRRVGGGFPNNRVSPVSKKPSRTVPSSSAPKRSFELALRQMDQRKSPPNRFRPLLSSVPSSTFHAGKTSAAHRVLISRNSSVTTSSNASSDLVASGVHDNEASDQNQEDVTSKYVKESDRDVEEDLFMFDRAETTNEDLGHEHDCRSPRNRNTAMEMAATSDMDLLLCPNCGRRYSAVESIEEVSIEEDPLKLCLKCQKLHLPLTMSVTAPLTGTVVAENSTSVSIVKEHESFDESQEVTSTSGSKSGQQEGQHCYSEPIWNFLPEEDEHRHASQQVICHSPSVSSMPDSDVMSEKMQYSGDFPNLKIGSLDGGHGAGISILLKKSSSSIGTVVQSRIFSASSISFDDLSYVRGSTNSMRSSVGHGTSVSASSSVDLGRFQRQQSSRKSDVENYRFDPFAKHQRSVSSLSGNSSQAFQPSGLGTSTQDLGKDTADMSSVPSQEQLIMSAFTEIDDSCTDVGKNHVSVFLGGDSAATFSNLEESASYESVENSKNNILEGEASVATLTTVDIDEVAEIPSQSSTISEIEIENTSQHSAGSQYDTHSSSSRCSIDEPMEPPSLTVSDDVAVKAEERDTSDHALSIVAESTVMVRSEGGTTTRSLTLEEATDTILFCRSIVHNLAYDAATIAINKKTPSPSEASWELIPTTGKSDTDKSDPHSKNVSKRASKSQRTRQKKVEAESKSKPPLGLTKIDQKSDSPTTTRLVGVPNNAESIKPPKLESKCNCTIM